MKVTTQIIDKIEDVRRNDVIIWGRYIYVANGKVECEYVEVDLGNWSSFKECTVIRITVEEE